MNDTLRQIQKTPACLAAAGVFAFAPAKSTSVSRDLTPVPVVALKIIHKKLRPPDDVQWSGMDRPVVHARPGQRTSRPNQRGAEIDVPGAVGRWPCDQDVRLRAE